MMHIIAVEDEPTSLRGGQEMNLYEICRGLAQRGHQITLLYEREGNLLNEYQTFCDSTIKIDRYGFDRRRIGEIMQFLPSLAKLQTIPTRLNSIVFSNSCHPAFYSYLLASYRKLPLVCYIQSPSFDFNRQKRMALNSVSKFITVSQYMKQYWAGLGYEKDKIDVVLNGTDTNKFKPREDFAALRQQWDIPHDAKVVSYVGRLDKEKGIDILLKAFALLLQVDRNIRLLIAGRSVLGTSLNGVILEAEDYQNYLKTLTADLGLQNNVIFTGHIANTEAIYQASDVAVAPSLWAEPFGRVMIEAMACGVPIIASRTGGIPEILTGEFQAYLVEPGDEQALANAIQQNLYWRDRDPALGDRCRQHIINQFSYEKMVEGIENVFSKVVNHAELSSYSLHH